MELGKKQEILISVCGDKMKEKVIIFGATDTGKRVYNDIKDNVDVILFVDEDSKKWGTEIDGIGVKDPQEIVRCKFDYIYIGVLTYYQEVVSKLRTMGVPSSKIVGKYVELPTYARIEFLKNIHELLEEENILEGAVAELGVFRGDFAKEINRIFPDRVLYLFDSFEGFSMPDCEIELNRGYTEQNKIGYFSNTTEQIVIEKMKYPDKCRIYKGFFPDSAKEMDDELFCFVNIDVDLYAPTLAGLKFFYPKLVKGGIILVHDYFSKAFHGVRDAVKEYCKENQILYIPIGDTLSVAIRK